MTALAIGLFALLPAQGTGNDIWDRLSFDAEGRLRAESTFDNVDATTGNDIDDRHRGRLRFRLGAKYALTEELDAIARVSTASDGNDANNAHWDFGDGDGFNGTEIVMDRFYLDWRPVDEVDLRVGKQPHIFELPGVWGGDFLWDVDISPAGVAAKWAPETSGDFRFDARAAAYIATEVAADEDPKVLAGQANLYLPVDEVKLQLSSSLYDWMDNDDTAVAGNQGNSATTEDFLIWDTFLSGVLPGGPLDEMKLYIELMNNLDEGDNGWVLGGQLGTSQWKQGNKNLFALIYDIDGDAIFSPVAQDDTPVAGSGLNDGDGDGMDGIVFGGTYWWRDNVALKLWILTSDPEGADDDPIRLRFDFDFKVK
jgi:hypothetical protein